MYNRYVPQPDGSFRRNRMQDSRTPEPTPPEPQPSVSSPSVASPCTDKPQKAEHQYSKQRNHPDAGFLRQLLPKDFDTGDLIVILLLLLMAGDCEEDRNNALLTIALYFMM